MPTQLIHFPSCAALVLAGGRGSRFGGEKPLAPFRGTTLLGHLLEQLGALGFRERIVAAKDPARLRVALENIAAQSVGTPIIGTQTKWLADAGESFNPLAGLVAALRAARSDWIFACAADMPFAADRVLIEALFAAAPGEAAVAPLHAGELQPLCALWNRARSVELAEELFHAGNAGPRALLLKLHAKQLAWPEERPFLDADTREALKELESRAP